jgi:hypothetical protein
MRCATGAITSTIGNATSQDGSHAPIQSAAKPSTRPAVRAVAMPDTTKDINAESTKPNKAGAKRAEIIKLFLSALRE